MTHRPLVTVLSIVAVVPLLLAADARELASADGANLQRPVWSADGSQLSYEANFHEDKRIELYVGDPTVGHFLRVRPTTGSSSSITQGFSKVRGGEVAHELTWAPAGTNQFVYTASNEVQDYELYIGRGGPLTREPGADGGPAWSPDGRFLAFTSSRTGEGDLYLLDMQHPSEPPRRLTSLDDSSELFAAWSPDATQIAFVGHSDSGDNLWLIPALGDDPVQLTDWTGNQTRPSFSSDGRWIAFYANLEDEGRIDLYVVEPRSGAVPRLVVRGVVANSSGPSWLPDQERILVALDDDDRFDPLAVVDAKPDSSPHLVDLGTVGHGDIDVTSGENGEVRVAYVAQGRSGGDVADFKRLFLGVIPR